MRMNRHVALIGDSIRLQAAPYVRERLPISYQVHSPPENGKASGDMAARIQEWVPPNTFDIVHINCGLHDVRREPGEQTPRRSPEEYVASLRCIFDHLAAKAGSVIWATSTPVDESLHGGIDMPRWHASDVVTYNLLSVELATEYGFRINDIHGRLSGATQGLFMPDGVHFNHAGSQLIGHHIATAIQQVARRENIR